jgi:hypothetical protein
VASLDGAACSRYECVRFSSARLPCDTSGLKKLVASLSPRHYAPPYQVPSFLTFACRPAG